ncbi:MAG: hypothetical protein C6I00_05105 [Nitratiruptor sp.]|nr:hypothetical protein [Nitratiruptor sp.]NPA84289.1 flagellar filament capping protein FliD [Campylobacterota bacterium]
MADIYLSNLSGQFDYQQILDKYQQLKLQQIAILEQREDLILQKKSAFQTFTSMLEDFKGGLEALRDPGLVDQKVATISNEEVASVTITDPKALMPTQLEFTPTQLAQRDVWLSQAGVTSREEEVASQDGTLTLTIDGTDYSIDYSDSDTIDDIVTKINEATDAAQASLFFDGTNYRLILSSTKTGSDQAISMSDDGDLLDNLQLGGDYEDSHVQEAQNAKISIYGTEVESQDNTFSNLIDGLTIEVKRTSGDPVRVEVQNDDARVQRALEALLDSYNAMVDYSKEQTGEYGPLSGDFTLHSIRSALFNRMNPLLNQGLLEVDHTNGHLSLNLDRFKELIQEDRQGLADTFSQLSDQLGPYLESLFAKDGLLEERVDGYERQIRNYEDEIRSTATRIDHEIENLKERFIHLDSLLASLNSMQTSIAALLQPTSDQG